MMSDMHVAHDAEVATASFRRVFAAAHRLWNDNSPCQNVHGHNYNCLVTVKVPRSLMTEQGFTIPFGEIKRVVDKLDHTLILHVDDPKADKFEDLGIPIVWSRLMPSTENVAQTIANEIKAHLPTPGGGIVHVVLQETSHVEAEAWA